MKKTYVFGSLAILILAFLLIKFNLFKESKSSSTDSRTNKLTTEAVKDNDEKKSCCSEEESGKYSDNSIYNLESNWTTQNGDKITLGSLKGKPVVLTLFYASCTYACPLLINDMKKIQTALPKKKLENYNFVLVSIDPERDTPEKLLTTAKILNLDLTRWTLLTGNKDDVMNLAALIGFKFKDDGKGGFSHSNLITLLNEDGEIIHQHVGLNQNVDDVLLVLNKFN